MHRPRRRACAQGLPRTRRGAEGTEITTLEGLANGDELDPLQEAFCTEYAFQCGFCVSGMLFAAHELLASTPDPTDDEIKIALCGNLCRCTGYQNIVSAVRRAARNLA
jgi:aerobic-type carbon monoxide dehydrogenase small subunit (CoxS/CutS family)